MSISPLFRFVVNHFDFIVWWRVGESVAGCLPFFALTEFLTLSKKYIIFTLSRKKNAISWRIFVVKAHISCHATYMATKVQVISLDAVDRSACVFYFNIVSFCILNRMMMTRSLDTQVIVHEMEKIYCAKKINFIVKCVRSVFIFFFAFWWIYFSSFQKWLSTGREWQNIKINHFVILDSVNLLAVLFHFSSSSSSVLLAHVFNRFEKPIHFLKHTRTTSTLILSTVVINTANLVLANVFASLRSCSLRHSPSLPTKVLWVTK